MLQPKWKFRQRLYTHFDHIVHSAGEAFQIIHKFKTGEKRSFLPFIEEQHEHRRFSVYLENLRKLENGAEISDLEDVKKIRPIKRSGHRDSQIFSYYRHVLMQAYEPLLHSRGISEHVIAYRKIPTVGNPLKGKCNIHFAKEAFDEVVRRGNAVALTLDISKFFESLDHAFLYKKWSELVGEKSLPDDHAAVFKAVTDYSFVDADECYEKLGLIRFVRGKKEFLHCPYFISEHKKMLCYKDDYRKLIIGGGLVRKNDYRDQPIPQGIPQGSPISDVLANLYMIDFDQEMHALCINFGAYYKRYSDDILWICAPEHADHIEQTTKDAISRQGQNTLKISDKKTTRTLFCRENDTLSYGGDKFRYLGFSFDGKKALYKDETLQRFERDTTFSIQSFVRRAHLRGAGDEVKKIKGNGKSLGDNLNVSQIFHKVAYTNKSYVRAQREKNKKLSKHKQERVEGNFMTYHMRALKIFNTGNVTYRLSDSQLRNVKKKIERKITAEAQRFDPTYGVAGIK